MNRRSIKEKARILHCLVEGNSIQATSRMTGASKSTVAKLLVDVGQACGEYQNEALRNLTYERIQVGEICSFCYSKEKNLPEEKKGILGYGDVWTWTAICADTKLVPSWLIGGRDADYANIFMHDLASRLANKIQLTSDGHGAYLQAVENAFGENIDYAQLIKMYGASPEQPEKRYSSAGIIGARKEAVTGTPDKREISTSYVERNNLTMRMSMRRFTRLTNGFSKKIENLEHAVALHFMHYNFVRIHKSLRETPAMAAGVTDTLMTIEDIARLAE
jgi:IS1 family transposase